MATYDMSTVPVLAHVGWDPEAQYAALSAAGVIDNTVHPKTMAPRQGRRQPYGPLAGPTEVGWEPVRRFNALNKHVRVARGAKSVEHLACLRQSDPCFGTLLPASERTGKHELPYRPETRFNALNKYVRVPRGFKSVEHLECLRQSDPCFGTLLPASERTQKHELPYRPETRFNALNKYVRVPRGFKSVEHLECLRQSDPCFGTLLPASERTGKHELPYRPEKRFAALAIHLREARGTKSVEHLERLRQSDPCYHSLLPTSTAALRASHDVASLSSSSEGVVAASDGQSVSSVSSNESFESGEDEDVFERDASWRRLASSRGSGRLPRILSNHLFEVADDDDTPLPELLSSSPRSAHAPAWAPPRPTHNPAYAASALGPRPTHRARAALLERTSSDSEASDAAFSMRSAARTSYGERNSERSSNNTICDFLLDDRPADLSSSVDEVSDASAFSSGEWSPRDSLSMARDFQPRDAQPKEFAKESSKEVANPRDAGAASSSGRAAADLREALRAEFKAELKGEAAQSVAMAHHRKAPTKHPHAKPPPHAPAPAPPRAAQSSGGR